MPSNVNGGQGAFLILHSGSALIVATSCVVVSLAIYLYYRKLVQAVREYRQAALLVSLVMLFLGLDRLIDLFIGMYGFDWMAGGFDIAVTVIAIGCAMAVFLQFRRLDPGLLSKELHAANEQLSAERQERVRLVETLTRLNGELEGRVERRTRQLEQANRRFESALSGTSITVVEQDLDLRYVWVHNPPQGITAVELLGKRPEEVLHSDAAAESVRAKQRVLDTGIPEKVDVELPIGADARWFEERLEPVMQEGRITGVMTVAIDVTSHKRYEEHLKRLLREITHRSKNLLAVVQAIARRTASSVDTPAEFIDRFGARLQALSGAHDLFVGRSWQGVELVELVNREIESQHQDFRGQIGVHGDREILGLETAQNLALGLHEMATNAVRFGALSTPGGRVNITWRRIVVGERAMIELIWNETGGPAADTASPRGFGRTMIERLVPRAIDGTSEITFEDNGLTWTLRFPVEQIDEFR